MQGGEVIGAAQQRQLVSGWRALNVPPSASVYPLPHANTQATTSPRCDVEQIASDCGLLCINGRVGTQEHFDNVRGKLL